MAASPRVNTSQPSTVARTEKYYDITGTGTFLICTWLSALSTNGFQLSQRQMVMSVCTTIWTLRLGLFLFSRIHAAGKDSRFDKIRGNPVKFLVVWTIQGVWVALTALGVFIVNSRASGDEAGLGIVELAGCGLWVFGFVFETIADLQKTAFRADGRNKDKFISSGLWALSRHPNYFGEIVLWMGMYLIGVRSFVGLEHLAILSPLFVAFLLIRVSGIPLLERAADKRWQDSAEYRAYKARTAVLVPWVW